MQPQRRCRHRQSRRTALVCRFNGLNLRNRCTYNELPLINRPRSDDRLSWPKLADSWRTVYPQSGHMSTIDRAQARQSPLIKNRHGND